MNTATIEWDGQSYSVNDAIARAIEAHNFRNVHQAIEIYSAILSKVTDNSDVFFNLGKVLRDTGNYEDALLCYDKAVELAPNYPVIHNNRGNILQEIGRFDAALASYTIAITLKPDYSEAYINQGNVLQKLGRYAEAVASYDKAIEFRSTHAETYNNRGSALQQLGRYDEALASYDKAIALKPTHAAAYNNRGNLLQTLMRYDEAIGSFAKATELKPDDAEAYNNLGNSLASKGDMAGAEAMFLKSHALKPDFPHPLYGLTTIRKYTDINHDHIKAIQTLLSNSHLSNQNKEPLYFALGKIYDDCGQYDEAFECYSQGNHIINQQLSYNAKEVSSMTDHISDVFSKEFLTQHYEFASDSHTPLFIIGMPRSGTTLMASILSNHPAIATAGELPTIINIAKELPELLASATPYPQVVKELTSQAANHIIKQYETRLKRDISRAIPYIIDKQPLNFRYLGLITMLFPNAKIIHCMRDPLDTCLSNYFQRFTQYSDYSFDLNNIAHFYNDYLRLMDHWRLALPKPMIEVNYEDMVIHTEKTAQTILSALGLEWDDDCLTPHTNPNAIETASKWQVRQPIYQQSIKRWQHYENHIVPLQQMIGLQG